MAVAVQTTADVVHVIAAMKVAVAAKVIVVV